LISETPVDQKGVSILSATAPSRPSERVQPLVHDGWHALWSAAGSSVWVGVGLAVVGSIALICRSRSRNRPQRRLSSVPAEAVLPVVPHVGQRS
jgi:hypothetical protein